MDNVVEVTQEHIDKGVQRKIDTCPVALALNEWSGQEWYVLLKYAHGRGYSNKWKLDSRVESWIIMFDNDGPVQPMTLMMDGKCRTIRRQDSAGFAELC